MEVKNWHTRTAVVVFDGILVFLFVNLVLYLFFGLTQPRQGGRPWTRYGADALLKAYPGWRSEDIKTMLTEEWEKLPEDYEPFTAFKERPLRGKFVNIDPAGFRISKGQAPWPPRPDALSVFLFGGSTTFGYGLPDDQTIPSYLGECEVPSPFGSHLAVYNFGRGSYFSSQERILFQQLLVAGFIPRVAVFIDGTNEFYFANGQPFGTARLRDFVAGKPPPSAVDALPVIRAARWLKGRWTRPQPQRAFDPADPAVLEGVIRRWLANKKLIEAMGAAFGVRAIFVWQPVPVYKYDLHYHFLGISDQAYGPDIRTRYAYTQVANLRAQGKFPSDVLWLADMQQDKHENLYVDQWHYTAPFAEEIAARICSALRESLAEAPNSGKRQEPGHD
jgi:hypothetical protein